MRELMVVEDVLLSMFPELVPVGASGGPLPFSRVVNSDQQTGQWRPSRPARRRARRMPDQLTRQIAC